MDAGASSEPEKTVVARPRRERGTSPRRRLLVVAKRHPLPSGPATSRCAAGPAERADQECQAAETCPPRVSKAAIASCIAGAPGVHKPRQMTVGQPLAHAQRQQQLLLAIARDEVLRHPEMVLTAADGPALCAATSAQSASGYVRVAAIACSGSANLRRRRIRSSGRRNSSGTASTCGYPSCPARAPRDRRGRTVV